MEWILVSASPQTCTDCKVEPECIALCVATFLKLSISSHFGCDLVYADGKQKTIADFTVQNIKAGEGGTYLWLGLFKQKTLREEVYFKASPVLSVSVCPHLPLPLPSPFPLSLFPIKFLKLDSLCLNSNRFPCMTKLLSLLLLGPPTPVTNCIFRKEPCRASLVGTLSPSM